MDTLKKGGNTGSRFMVIRKPNGSVTTIGHRNDAWGLDVTVVRSGDAATVNRGKRMQV